MGRSGGVSKLPLEFAKRTATCIVFWRMKFDEFALLLQSLRYTRWRQLWHRVRLHVRRRILRPRTLRPASRVRLSSVLPLGSGLPGERMLFGVEPRRSVRLLSQDVTLCVPMDWSVSAIAVGRPLAELEIHYLTWVRELSDDEFLRVSEDWISGNRRALGRWWNTSWNSYGLSIRTLVWMQEIAARFDRLSEDRRQALCNEIAFQIRFLEQNLELDLGGNHLLKNLVALLWAGRFFEGADAERWTRRGSELLARELDEQMLADGMHFERSPAYHALVLLDLLDIHRVLGEGPLRAGLSEVLARGGQALADLTHPDGGISLFNDGGLHKAPRTTEVLDVLRRQVPGAYAPRSVFAMPECGYFGLRHGSDLFLADCGKIAPDHLPAHGHGDILSFEWSVDGKRIVTDFGVYEYTAGPWRELSRATRSHNTVTVGDGDQCEFWSSFRVGRRARILKQQFEPSAFGFVLRGAHDGYCHLPGRPVHERCFTVDAAGAVIRDEVRGGRGQPVRARLLFHPDCQLHLAPGLLTVEQKGTKVTVEFEGQGHLEDSWWCPDFGSKHKAQQLVLDYGPAPCQGGFRLRKVTASHS